MSSRLKQPSRSKGNTSRLYPASWMDHLTAWVNHLPVPAWAFFLSVWLILILIESGSKWLDGVEPFFRLRLIYVLYSFYGVYFLAAIHYLDRWAENAFEKFLPVLGVSEAEKSRLLYHLTTMPAATVWLLSAAALASVALLYQPLLVPLWQAMGFDHHSAAAVLVDAGIFTFNSLTVVIFVYHTLRQLSWISRIHGAASRINLFQIRPVYAFSGLTARTAGILLFVGTVIQQQTRSHGEFTTDPYALQMSWLFMLISILFYSLLAIAVFLLPLLGLHTLLLREKERLKTEANTRLQSLIQELHQRIDSHKMDDADAINKHLSSLALERDILAKLPTWPWQPGTLNFLLTAVLLPFMLWVMQQLIERWAGF